MTVMKTLPPNPIVAVGGARFGNDLPLAVIAGPCALESRAHALESATATLLPDGKVLAAGGLGGTGRENIAPM